MANRPGKEPESRLVVAAKDILSGTFGGIAQVFAGHPLDTVKVRLQTQVIEPGKPPPFTGMVDCFRKTFANEGIRGLYKGCASPLSGAMVLNATLFFAYGQSKLIVRQGLRPDQELSLSRYFLAGGMAGGFVCIAETPFDLLKVSCSRKSARASTRACLMQPATS